MELSKASILLFLISLGFIAEAQQNRYMVFFKDKSGSSYSIDAPEAYLSSRAIERRSKSNISIGEDDLPVNEGYVQQVQELGVQTYFTTKWMNGVLVQTEESNVEAISDLDIVSSVELVAPGAVLTRSQKAAPVASSFEPVTATDLTTNRQLELIGVDSMHQEGNFGQGVLVAVMDGGFSGAYNSNAFRYQYANDKVLYTRDLVSDGFDIYQYSSHGTSVWSCLAANEGEELRGVATEADYALFVTEEVGSEYRVEEYNWLFAAEIADSMGVDIINTSLGYTDFDDASMNYSTSDMDGQTAVITRAAEIAFSKGMLIVSSAGNLGDNSWRFISAPADGEHVLAIGAIDLNSALADFSSVGPSADGRVKPDVVGPGSSVTVFSSSVFRTGNGTSFSAPLITGLAAGLLSSNPDWTNTTLFNAIRNSGSNATNPNNEIGYGTPNYIPGASAIVLNLTPEKPNISLYPNPTGLERSVILQLDHNTFKKGMLLNIKGKKLMQFPINGPGKYDIDVQHLESGIYFLALRGKNVTETLKLLKN